MLALWLLSPVSEHGVFLEWTWLSINLDAPLGTKLTPAAEDHKGSPGKNMVPGVLWGFLFLSHSDTTKHRKRELLRRTK